MRPAIVAALALFCLVLAACGGGDGEEPVGTDRGTEARGMPEPDADAGAPENGPGASDDEKEEEGRAADPEAKLGIRAAIENAIASGDPERACGAAVTESFLRDTYGDAAGCRGAQSAGLAARSVEVGRISIDGDRARTTVRAEGGPYAGEKLGAHLVREGSAWKLDRLRSNAPPGP